MHGGGYRLGEEILPVNQVAKCQYLTYLTITRNDFGLEPTNRQNVM